MPQLQPFLEEVQLQRPQYLADETQEHQLDRCLALQQEESLLYL